MYCGAIKMKQACQQVEAMLASVDTTSIDELFQQLINVIIDTQGYIDSYL